MRYIHADGVTSERSGDRVLVLDPTGETMTTLNPVGALIWDWLATPTSPEALVDRLAARFPDVPAEQARADAERFVGELRSAGLVSVADADG